MQGRETNQYLLPSVILKNSDALITRTEKLDGMKEITIYDIAEGLGISPTTVSRALNDHPAVNENTKKRVYKAATDLGYRSNIFASNLRSKRTHTVGVIVPRLNSPFQSAVLAGMEKVANESGFNLLISQSLESFQKEIANTKTMFNSRVDGLLISLASNTENIDHIKPFMQKGIPVLFFDRVAEHPECTGVIIDNTQAAYNATQHLIQQGCTNIMHVLGNTKINVYSNRLKGYRYALIDHGISYNANNIIFSELNEEAGMEIAEDIISREERPDGLIVSNDTCAASCIVALKQKGIKIPQDIAVVGFNNDMISRMIEPQLTTVDYPGYEMGEVAMKNLINHLNGNYQAVLHNTNTITLRSELIIRDSSKRVKA